MLEPAIRTCVNHRVKVPVIKLFCSLLQRATMASSGSLTDKEVEKICVSPDPATQGYYMQQTMYRIKDPKKTLKFYTEVLGMTLLQKLDFPSMKFTIYFMGYENPSEIPKDYDARTVWCLSKKATVELTHNWGTENDSNFTYHNGNSDPRGFGHIGIVVPDVQKACDRFEKFDVEFVKRPNDGKMRGIAFIKDPDGYWIEILTNAPVKDPSS